jgi:RHH-type proline utilization regulon transcriptional repressor/proline dehydrogenase/delta 1-pyrroline-5-carboxylate dehydrogenase
MSTTTVGIKIDELLRERLKSAARKVGRSPHWLLKHAVVSLLDEIDRGYVPPRLSADVAAPGAIPATEERTSYPFLEFAQSVHPQSVLRAAITSAYRRPETECLPLLLDDAQLPETMVRSAQTLARQLVEALRRKQSGGGVAGLIHEFSLSNQEGVALMCLAEALLRIPDKPTRDALIRDKVSVGDWQSHLGHSPSLFVNAAAWGLMITGKLVSTSSETGLSTAVTRLIAKGGEPLIRKGVDMAMRLLGEQFVSGQTIAEALANSRKLESRGFRHSYDMLGEAATTAEDAGRYYADYERAVHAIGRSARHRGIYEGPGISIKLSALHPRYARAQQERVMQELLPRVKALAVLARQYDIGLNIDAEEADRLEISFDLLEALCFEPELAGWNGIGFVVQAYQKRAPFALDFLIDLARRSKRRLMVRLVKGAYWDAEIKRAQVDGLEGFPVYTRKIHTDVAYLACARKLLAIPDAVFPQLATHNAYTLAAIHKMAGENYYPGQYEFQCLHGMGEPLYEEVVGPGKLNRPCRIYAPVGTHETLLAYLVRRLLENGANTSFVNRIADPNVSVDELVADPVEQARAIAPIGAPHPKIRLPQDLFQPERDNSAGIDLTNEHRLGSLSAALLGNADTLQWAASLLAGGQGQGPARAIRNPADHRDVVGHVVEADESTIETAVAHAVAAAPVWQATPPQERARCLVAAADLMESRMSALLGTIVREAGKTLSNAVGEVREAVDFLRYYAARIGEDFSNDTHRPLGPIVCISPWNFPLAIFTGQVAAALAAGNPVLAKPAEETPLIAAAAVRILREAGVPEGALQLLPGDGDVGARLVADARVRGVLFTGSTEVARLIQAALADRLNPDGRPVPFIAETGGQNALIIDSSALPEQVVGDVLTSAFDSAGQRCSALRVLCLQEEIADRMLSMLKGAMAELSVGNPDRLSTDVGPVIASSARDTIIEHIARLQTQGRAVHALALPEFCRHGTFVSPTLIEIPDMSDLKREVFGPVLHVLRYRRERLDGLVDEINASGYGLTFGVHSRIDETIARVTARIRAGNIYVNRNLIGAVVGVQPFGGQGLSGTGPKAGGPLYLDRLLAARPPRALLGTAPAGPLAPARAWRDWLLAKGREAEAKRCDAYLGRGWAGKARELPGPVGERNIYTLAPRGSVLCVAQTVLGACEQVSAALATGNHAIVAAEPEVRAVLTDLPPPLGEHVAVTEAWDDLPFDAVLFEGDSDALRSLARRIAERPGPVIGVHIARDAKLAEAPRAYDLEALMLERSVSTNTAAAGGNASLMTIG